MKSGEETRKSKNLGPYRATKLWNELVCAFRSGMPLRRHRRYMKSYEDCFSASEAVAWLLEHLRTNPNYGPNVSRAQAVQLLGKFQQWRIFEDVRVPHKYDTGFSDGGRLFRLLQEPTATPLKPRSPGARAPLAARTALMNGADASPQFTRKTTATSAKTTGQATDTFTGSTPPPRKPGKLTLASSGDECENNWTTISAPDRFQSDNSQSENQYLVKNGITTEKHNKTNINNGFHCNYTLNNDRLGNYTLSNDHLGNPAWLGSSAVAPPIKSLWNAEDRTGDRTRDRGTGRSESCDALDRRSRALSAGDCSDNHYGDNHYGDSARDDGGEVAGEQLTEAEVQQVWKTMLLNRLQDVLCVTSLRDVLDADGVVASDVTHNMTHVNKNGVVTHIKEKDQLPQWVLRAMRYLAYWPSASEDVPHYAGFERDVFHAITDDYLARLPGPLCPPQVYDALTGVLACLEEQEPVQISPTPPSPHSPHTPPPPPLLPVSAALPHSDSLESLMADLTFDALGSPAGLRALSGEERGRMARRGAVKARKGASRRGGGVAAPAVPVGSPLRPGDIMLVLDSEVLLSRSGGGASRGACGVGPERASLPDLVQQTYGTARRIKKQHTNNNTTATHINAYSADRWRTDDYPISSNSDYNGGDYDAHMYSTSTAIFGLHRQHSASTLGGTSSSYQQQSSRQRQQRAAGRYETSFGVNTPEPRTRLVSNPRLATMEQQQQQQRGSLLRGSVSSGALLDVSRSMNDLHSDVTSSSVGGREEGGEGERQRRGSERGGSVGVARAVLGSRPSNVNTERSRWSVSPPQPLDRATGLANNSATHRLASTSSLRSLPGAAPQLAAPLARPEADLSLSVSQQGLAGVGPSPSGTNNAGSSSCSPAVASAGYQPRTCPVIGTYRSSSKLNQLMFSSVQVPPPYIPPPGYTHVAPTSGAAASIDSSHRRCVTSAIRQNSTRTPPGDQTSTHAWNIAAGGMSRQQTSHNVNRKDSNPGTRSSRTSPPSAGSGGRSTFRSHGSHESETRSVTISPSRASSLSSPRESVFYSCERSTSVAEPPRVVANSRVVAGSDQQQGKAEVGSKRCASSTLGRTRASQAFLQRLLDSQQQQQQHYVRSAETGDEEAESGGGDALRPGQLAESYLRATEHDESLRGGERGKRGEGGVATRGQGLSRAYSSPNVSSPTSTCSPTSTSEDSGFESNGAGGRLMEAVRLVLLTLPPPQRRTLHLVLRFVHKLVHNESLVLSPAQPTPQFVLSEVWRCVLRPSVDTDLNAALARQLVAYMADNYVSLLAVPKELAARATNKLEHLAQAKRRFFRAGFAHGVTYCRQVSLLEYERQRHSGVHVHLLQLLDALVEAKNMAPRERRKRLKQFQRCHPDVYQKRFPNSTRSESDLHSLKPARPRLLSRLKSLRI